MTRDESIMTEEAGASSVSPSGNEAPREDEESPAPPSFLENGGGSDSALISTEVIDDSSVSDLSAWGIEDFVPDGDPAPGSDPPSSQSAPETPEVLEEESAEDSATGAYIRLLESQLLEKEVKMREYGDAYRAAVAEMNAAKERMRRDQEKVLQRERANFLKELLEVVDNLDRSVDGVRRTGDVDTLVKGLEMVQQMFLTRLKGLGVERMGVLGQAFDPRFHEAIASIPVQNDDQDQRVFHEERAGYLFQGEVLRAARVIVGGKIDC